MVVIGIKEAVYDMRLRKAAFFVTGHDLGIAPSADEKCLCTRLTTEINNEEDHSATETTALMFRSHGKVLYLEKSVSFVREHTHRTKI